MRRFPISPEVWQDCLRAALFVALAAAGLAAAHLQPIKDGSVPFSARAWGDGFSYGWPMRAVRRYEVDRPAFRRLPIGYEVEPAGLLVDVSMSASILVCTGVVAAYWLSRPRRWFQLSLFEWFAATSVIAALIWFYINEEHIYRGLHEPGRRPLHEMPAYAIVGLWLGMSCVLFGTGRLIAQIAAKLRDPQPGAGGRKGRSR